MIVVRKMDQISRRETSCEPLSMLLGDILTRQLALYARRVRPVAAISYNTLTVYTDIYVPLTLECRNECVHEREEKQHSCLGIPPSLHGKSALGWRHASYLT